MDKEYIEREVVINTFCEDCERHSDANSFACSMCEDVKEIMKIPAANVVEVVRCKDCKYSEKNTMALKDGIAVCKVWSDCADRTILVREDDFCSCGDKNNE